MADYTPVYDGGAKPFSKTAVGAVVGGTLAVASGASGVATAGAAATTVIGVFAFDAASGARVSVWPLANVEHEITASGGVTAADGVVAAASGQVATAAVATAAAAGTLLGIASTTATTGNKVRFVGRG